MKRKKKKPHFRHTWVAGLFTLIFIIGVFLLSLENSDEIVKKEKEEDEIILEEDEFLEESFLEKIEDEKIIDNSDEITFPFEISGKNIFLYDLKEEEILYSKNPEKTIVPASLTKIMTAILVLENVEDWENTKVTYKDYMGKEILEYGYSLEDIAAYEYKEGEQMTIKDSLYLLMLKSANDTANLLGEHVGGTLDNFIVMMNEKAKEIGVRNTNFSNTHGLDHENLYTTAYDMFLITRYAMEVPNFNQIISTLTYTLEENNFHEKREIINVLGIMNPKYPEFFYPYFVMGKSGYTNAAGRCLISIARKNEKEYLLILMNVPIYDVNEEKVSSSLFFTETIEIFDWFF